MSITMDDYTPFYLELGHSVARTLAAARSRHDHDLLLHPVEDLRLDAMLPSDDLGRLAETVPFFLRERHALRFQVQPDGHWLIAA